jgi:hypothetical protein
MEPKNGAMKGYMPVMADADLLTLMRSRIRISVKVKRRNRFHIKVMRIRNTCMGVKVTAGGMVS